MPGTVADENLPPVVMPSCEERRILAGQKALVTGGSSGGIGRAVALALGGAGADVAVNYRSGEEEAQEVVSAIKDKGSKAIAAGGRFQRGSSAGDVRSHVRGVRHDRHPGRECRPAERCAFDQMTLQDWNTVLDVNLTGQFLCAREAVREFKRRGCARRSPAPPARSSA